MPILSVQERALGDYLPALARSLPKYGFDVEALVEKSIANCPELRPTTQWNALEAEKLHFDYNWIILAISRSSTANVGNNIYNVMLDRLNECLSEDKKERRTCANVEFSIQTQRQFRRWAEISHATQSSQITRVLSTFFVDNAAYIASHDSSRALGQWCYALIRAPLRAEDCFDCLRRVLRERLNLCQRLATTGWKGQVVVGKLSKVASLMRLEVRPRNDFHPRRRWDDRQLLFGEGNRLHRRFGNDGLLYESERIPRVQDEAVRQNRRMLQLSMGRRYGNRYGNRPDIDRLGGAFADMCLHDFPEDVFEDVLRDDGMTFI